MFSTCDSCQLKIIRTYVAKNFQASKDMNFHVTLGLRAKLDLDSSFLFVSPTITG